MMGEEDFHLDESILNSSLMKSGPVNNPFEEEKMGPGTQAFMGEDDHYSS